MNFRSQKLLNNRFNILSEMNGSEQKEKNQSKMNYMNARDIILTCCCFFFLLLFNQMSNNKKVTVTM